MSLASVNTRMSSEDLQMADIERSKRAKLDQMNATKVYFEKMQDKILSSKAEAASNDYLNVMNQLQKEIKEQNALGLIERRSNFKQTKKRDEKAEMKEKEKSQIKQMPAPAALPKVATLPSKKKHTLTSEDKLL